MRNEFIVDRLLRRNLGAGVYHIYDRCASNLWILDPPECRNKFLDLLERLSVIFPLNIRFGNRLVMKYFAKTTLNI